MNGYYYFSRDTGWGDTLWHLTNALSHCERNNKSILIDMRGSWISKGKKNLFNEYFKSINTDIKVITAEEEIDALKKDAEPHSDSCIVIKNPLKSKEDSKKFYEVFKRIQPSNLVSREVNKIIVNQFSGNYIVGVHGRCSNGEVIPEKKNQLK
jgi:hypothetical protein